MLPEMVDPLPAPAPAAGIKGEVRLLEPARWERAVARRSAESRATVPHVELDAEAQADAILARDAEVGCGAAAILLRACALALRQVPRANSAYRDGRFELYSRVNIGLIVAEEDIYTIPTVFDADDKSLTELGEELATLTARAREGGLTPPELAGATFTLWNPGAHGISRASPLVVPPQAAALAAGTIRRVCVPRGEALVGGHAITLSLACDHRILYGAQAARFLDRIRRLLEAGSL
jgi:pyruvate dehydrogenase E2 component (dihydrolipoamide acetyltransferase)